MRLSFSTKASLDLVGLLEFGVESWGEVAARRYSDRLTARIAGLLEHPELGPPANEVGIGLRRISAGSHVVFYRVRPNEIWISRILHASQEPRLHQI